MKIISKVTLWIGIIVVVAALVVAVKVSLDIFGNMQPKNSVPPINPYPWIWAAVGGAILGGFLAGLGLGTRPKAKPEPATPVTSAAVPEPTPAAASEPTPPPAA